MILVKARQYTEGWSPTLEDQQRESRPVQEVEKGAGISW